MKKIIPAALPAGFAANAVSCGIKRKAKPDLALFYSQRPAVTCAMFTTNSILAAPLVLDKKHLQSSGGYAQAILVNSGNANCFTGSQGLKDAGETALSAARQLGIDKKRVLVSSTGIIGRALPVAKIRRAIPLLACGLSRSGIHKARQAILTTDTFAKDAAICFSAAGSKITLYGVAKGAGMIAPDMATMLCFIFTDARISARALKLALSRAVESSFNCITVDGCMSTNDSVIVMANAVSGTPLIDRGAYYARFASALQELCLELAKKVVRDAEGASKFIRIDVESAKDAKEARAVALEIANSNLFKTALFGENPNFGRIAAAVGASGVGVKEKDLKIKVSPLKRKDVNVRVWLKRGKAGATVYTADLTPEYIKINAAYN